MRHLVSGSELQRLPARLGPTDEVAPKVSNELSNYCGANRYPRLDDPGSFRAPGIGIDAAPCFGTKRSQPQIDPTNSNRSRCSRLAPIRKYSSKVFNTSAQDLSSRRYASRVAAELAFA